MLSDSSEQLDFTPEIDMDCYPSRNGQKAQLVDRLDPVTYPPKAQLPPIGQAAIKQYATQGFIVLEDVFTAEEVGNFQAELLRLEEDESIRSSGEIITEPGSDEIRSIFRVHESSPVFKQVAVDQRLASVASYLLGDDVYIHQSRVNSKPGLSGKEFYWHSDFETWHVEDGMPRMRALSISISLTENFHHNGPLMFVPGSHLQYAVCEGSTPKNHFLSSLKAQEYGIPSNDCLQTLIEKGDIVSIVSKPGSVTVFDCNLIHGSNSNITPHARSNAFFVYNSVNNKVVSPFSGLLPRPEHICSRNKINPIISTAKVST